MAEQIDMFPPPAFHALVDARAEEIKAEFAALARSAIEEIDRRIAFYRRSQAQRKRFERYRRLVSLHGAT